MKSSFSAPWKPKHINTNKRCDIRLRTVMSRLLNWQRWITTASVTDSLYSRSLNKNSFVVYHLVHDMFFHALLYSAAHTSVELQVFMYNPVKRHTYNNVFRMFLFFRHCIAKGKSTQICGGRWNYLRLYRPTVTGTDVIDWSSKRRNVNIDHVLLHSNWKFLNAD